ncbi:MAG: hypothetical protein DRP08_05195 [Candidatus Aenigmatarchaeota archaeon]|nr:MAG: hypothetical protein DRP08_05195 [Candidatus Aenigmarchaeota archaeon]
MSETEYVEILGHKIPVKSQLHSDEAEVRVIRQMLDIIGVPYAKSILVDVQGGVADVKGKPMVALKITFVTCYCDIQPTEENARRIVEHLRDRRIGIAILPVFDLQGEIE